MPEAKYREDARIAAAYLAAAIIRNKSILDETIAANVYAKVLREVRTVLQYPDLQ